MEMAQERELQAWWPLDTMACGLDASSGCSLFGWDPQLFYFGQAPTGIGAGDSVVVYECHEHDLLLVPKSMESLVSETSTAVTGLPTVQLDARATTRRELDELLQNLWDSDEEGLSFCRALKEGDDSSQRDHHFHLGTASPTAPTSPLKPPKAEAPSSSSSQSSGGGPRASTAAHRQTVAAKRSAPEGKESCKGGESSKRSRVAAGVGSSVLRPFAVVKPSGEATLAEINEWIRTPPARPVRHPVGEFASAPRLSAGNRPAPSGKTVAGFTRLHTAGRGTVTVVRTRD